MRIDLVLPVPLKEVTKNDLCRRRFGWPFPFTKVVTGGLGELGLDVGVCRVNSFLGDLQAPCFHAVQRQHCYIVPPAAALTLCQSCSDIRMFVHDLISRH